MPQREQAYQPAILRFLFFSCVNFAAWWPLLYNLIGEQYWLTNPFRGSVLIILVLLVVPFVLGSFIGFLVKNEWPYKVLRFLKINILHPRSTGWDYIMEQASWVIVTLKNGSIIYGLYSTRSLASSIPSDKDMYIEELYTCDDNGKWEQVTDSKGIWIPGDQIMYIEFRQISIEEESNNDNEKKSD